MSEPICRTDKETNEQRPATMQEFLDAISGHVVDRPSAIDAIVRGESVETSFAFYTLSAQWLLDGHKGEEFERFK